MLRKIFFALLILLPFISIAQNNTGIPIPMKKKIVFYDKSFPVEGGFIRREFSIAATKWFKNEFPGNAEPFHIGESGDINCTGIFKINTSATGDYYKLKFKLEIASNDTGYTIKAYDFYENSNVNGKSLEYSKIEYRWWDYRQGKPWSAGDKALFMGLDSDMTALFKSFGNDPSIISSARRMHTPKFKVLAFFSTNVEDDHVDFAYDAIKFYKKMADQKGFVFDTTSNWENLNDANLAKYKEVIWLNEFPHNEAERRSFEKFMDGGGSWLGFHVSGYNDKDTHWPWFVKFMGGAVFFNNNWPPLPAKMIVDDNKHPITRHLPKNYTAPINEWYGWKPNPRLNKDVKVLVTLDPTNYPLGKKDVIKSGDIPVVWTNTKYKMVYMNMGHGDMNFESPLQNKMFEDAVLWLGE
jgi:uncharacterized protein